jgi:acyl-CoA synthetase (NDP forming)
VNKGALSSSANPAGESYLDTLAAEKGVGERAILIPDLDWSARPLFNKRNDKDIERMTSTEEIIAQARRQGRNILTEIESKEIVQQAGIPVTEARLAPSVEDAVSLAGEIGYPVVLKVVSPAISHKSDVGGVRLNLVSEEQVSAAFNELRFAAEKAAPDSPFLGVSVQSMAAPGTEVILGLSTDPQFGPVLMFGLGGVAVEVLKDVAFRLVPLEPVDARDMIREIKAFPLLEGHRGQRPADLATLESLILRISDLVERHPEITEIDLNPVFAYTDGAIAVDARIVVTA